MREGMRLMEIAHVDDVSEEVRCSSVFSQMGLDLLRPRQEQPL